MKTTSNNQLPWCTPTGSRAIRSGRLVQPGQTYSAHGVSRPGTLIESMPQGTWLSAHDRRFRPLRPERPRNRTRATVRGRRASERVPPCLPGAGIPRRASAGRARGARPARSRTAPGSATQGRGAPSRTSRPVRSASDGRAAQSKAQLAADGARGPTASPRPARPPRGAARTASAPRPPFGLARERHRASACHIEPGPSATRSTTPTDQQLGRCRLFGRCGSVRRTPSRWRAAAGRLTCVMLLNTHATGDRAPDTVRRCPTRLPRECGR
jgi:hypothetical protein